MTNYRWGIYVRISDDRREGAGLGVKRQEKDIREMIARIDPGGVVAKVYVDNDISAYSGKPRPGYREMLAGITDGTINAVGTWHTDRLHRQPRELEDYIDACEPRGVPTHTVKAGEFDLSTGAAQMTARILGAVAAHESRHKAERVAAKHRELAAAGKPNGGGWRPYGYERIWDRPERPHRLIRLDLIPEEAEIIRECARRVMAGEGLHGVARDLNRRGVRTSTGGEWSTNTLAQMLVSARIAGWREHQPRASKDTRRLRIGTLTAKGEWPPVISLEDSTWLRDHLTGADRITTPGRTGRWLCAGGVLKCARCGKNLVGRARGSGRPGAYICDGQPGQRGCGRMYINAAATDEVITMWVAGALAGPAYLAALREAGSGPDESQLAGEIAAAERRRKEMARDYANDVISRQEWLEGRQATTARIDRATRQMRAADSILVLDGLPADAAGLEAFLLDTGIPVSRRRAVIKAVLVKVTVSPAAVIGQRFDVGRLEPEWRA